MSEPNEPEIMFWRRNLDGWVALPISEMDEGERWDYENDPGWRKRNVGVRNPKA